VDCVLSEWTEWSSCSQTCGTGKHTRERHVATPARFGGRQCDDRRSARFEQEACPGGACASHGVWSGWAAWSYCSLTCGRGTRTRSRRCDSPPPENGGRDCQGEATQSKECQVKVMFPYYYFT
jgi:hypothetical protein